MWFDSEKEKLLSSLKKDGQKLVNEEEIIENYFEEDKKENNVSSALMRMFGGV